ncbi:MAG: hypothetical protein AAFV29_00935, partial [Myxococcota bacterium]
MAWKHYTFGRTRSDPAPRFHPEPPQCAPARSLADLLEESTGLARAGAAAVCWDGQMAAVVQVHIAGTDIEGRPQSEVRIREREADANAFAGFCLALFHKRPIESEAEWDHATLEIADRGHDRLAAPVLSSLSQLWTPSKAALAAMPAPTVGVREEAADACLTIRAVVALSGLPAPVVVAHSSRSFASVWGSEKWWTLLIANDAPDDSGPSSFAHVQRFLQTNSRGFSELQFYGDKLLEPPSLERLQRSVFISTAVEESARRSSTGPTFVDLPRLIDLQRRTETRSPPRVWEVIRSQMHNVVASDRFVPAPNAPTQVHGYVGDSHAVILELGESSLQSLVRVRDLLGERVADQVRLAIEERLPVDDAIHSASKTVAQQSNHVVKLRLAREGARVIDEIRALPAGAARRVELSALVCDLMQDKTPLDLFVAAKRSPSDRVANGLTKLAPRWSGPPEALQRPVSELNADWLVDNGETVLMTARRIGADTFSFWVPILVEALLRAASPPSRLIEALLRTNLVGLDDSAALIRHGSTATDFVRSRTLELWTSGHRLMGLEAWLPRPTQNTIDEVYERLPKPADDDPPVIEGLADPLATLLWGFASRIRHDRPSIAWARAAAERVEDNADVMALRALLHQSSTWLPLARDLWLTGFGRLLEGVPFDSTHLEYVARDVRGDDDIEERNLLARGTPSAMTELATDRLIPWLRAYRWADDWINDRPSAVEHLVGAWRSADASNRRAIRNYAWSMVASRSPQPRPVWLDRAWTAWTSQAGPEETRVSFLKSFPTYLQVELVALGHVSLGEVEIMAKTSLPLINVFILRGTGTFEAAVLYEVPVSATWSLVTALPPGVALPDSIAQASGEQQDILQSAATALDELAMPFCLGIWNHTALSWKEGRHAWVASDGRVVCLNTDREPSWYDPMRNGFGGDPTQRMLAVAAAASAPDEMLEASPRAHVVKGHGRGRRDASLDLLRGRSRVGALLGIALLFLAAVAGTFFFWNRPTAAPLSDAVEPVEPVAAAPASSVTVNAVAEAKPAPSAPVECPYTPANL